MKALYTWIVYCLMMETVAQRDTGLKSLIGVENIALGKRTRQSSDYTEGNFTFSSKLSVDGNEDGDFSHKSCSSTNSSGPRPAWWSVDLGEERILKTIVIFNRIGMNYRLDGARVLGFTKNGTRIEINSTANYTQDVIKIDVNIDKRLQNVTIILGNNSNTENIVNICEVEIYAIKQCNKSLPPVAHGVLLFQDGVEGNRSYNATVSLNCLEGYKLERSGQLRCADDEQWQGSLGRCLVKRCNQSLPQAPHSSQIFMDGIEGNGTYNTTVSLNCLDGYKLVVGGQSRCSDDEQWHGSLGLCMVKRCNQSLPQDPHGFITVKGGLEGNGTYNTTLSLNCQEGYKLVGGGQSRCADDEQWQGSIGLCLGKTLKCFSCQDMTHLKYCNLLDQCQEDMGCYLEQFYVGEHVRYNSGCISQGNHVCDLEETVPSQCTRCCNTSYCNSHGCGDNGFEVKEKRGPLCYDCQHLGDPSECLNIQECAEFEICHITEFRWGTHDRLYSMGCQPRHHCTSHSVPVNPDHIIVGRAVPTCNRCCAEDFCNLNCTSH